MTTGGYTLLDVPVPKQTLIHVHAGAEELGRVYQPALAINAGMAQFAAAARAPGAGRPIALGGPHRPGAPRLPRHARA